MTFWNSLHGLVQGQLFAQGHLSPRTALALATRAAPARNDRCGGGKSQRRKIVVWPRLAIPH